MLVAVILGIVFGAISFIPFIVALKASKRVTATSNVSLSSLLLLSVFASFVLLFAGVLGCYFVAKDILLIFAISEVAVVVVAAFILAIYVRTRDTNSKNKNPKNAE